MSTDKSIEKKRPVRDVLDKIRHFGRGVVFRRYYKLRSALQSRHLTVVKRPDTAARKAEIVLVCCQRNEFHRLPKFLEYYRQLGVGYFYFIDNDSDDGSREYLIDQPDCAVWHTKASYKNSNFGMDWCNHVLGKFCSGRWAVCVDPDEFLIYPSCEHRNLKELTRYMDDIGQASLFTVMVDCYGRDTIAETILGAEDDPFEVCPYFDRFNFTQKFDSSGNNCWLQGGVRMRKMFANQPKHSPALNKVPLIKWNWRYSYISSMHSTTEHTLNCNLTQSKAYVSGALFHFKFVSALKDKAEEEIKRKQHFGDSREYARYRRTAQLKLYDWAVSVRFETSKTLENLKFIQRGDWF